MNLSISEQLSYSTVRLECHTPNGIQTGTGFFFKFLDDGSQFVPVVITNIHVIKNAITGKFIMTKSDENGEPILTEHYPIELNNFEQRWKLHPDSDVDLCAMPLAPVINYANDHSVNLFYRTFIKSLIPSPEQRDELTGLEDIIMIGYPNGIWDSVNNQPVFRKGTTATNPNINYNGKKEFVIDAACFPGSSGSPVMIYNTGGYQTRNGGIVMGNIRLLLLGVLYSGYQHTASGEIRVVDIPIAQQQTALSRIPNNLGIVIMADRILELESLFMTNSNDTN